MTNYVEFIVVLKIIIFNYVTKQTCIVLSKNPQKVAIDIIRSLTCFSYSQRLRAVRELQPDFGECSGVALFLQRQGLFCNQVWLGLVVLNKDHFQ